MNRPRGWLLLAAGLLGWACVTVVSGGLFLEWHGWRVSARDPVRPLLAAEAVIGFALWRYGRRTVRQDLSRVAIDLDRWGAPIAGALAIVILVVGVGWGTDIAGGADSYGYVSQARLWANGNLIEPQPLAAQLPWPKALHTLTPLGYTPAPTGDAIVPIYAPGLPMLMAAFSVLHPAGVFWVVPLAGAALVLLSFFLGRALGGSGAGLLTAVLVATSPAILFQLVAPMSDVPVAACWTAALVLALPNRRDRWLGAGVASSLAILTRPNTAPIAAVFVLLALWRDREGEAAMDVRQRLLNAVAYVTGCLPGVLSVAAIQTALYGSPFLSGYGSAGELFSFAYLAPNLARYPVWLIASETPIVLLALVAPVFLWQPRRARWLLAFTGLFALTVWACYLFYQPFDAWSYLRFLLIAFPCQLALAAVPATRRLTRIDLEWRVPLAIALLAPILLSRIDYAASHYTFESWKFEQRYAETGRAVEARLPANAVLFSGQQSGSLRYYSGRLTLRWLHLDPDWLDRSIAVLQQHGLEPYFVLEEGEEAEFRARFQQANRLGRLDWSPMLELETIPRVRIYQPPAKP